MLWLLLSTRYTKIGFYLCRFVSHFLARVIHKRKESKKKIERKKKPERRRANTTKKDFGKMSLQNKCIFQFLISIFSLRCKKKEASDSRSLFKRRWSGRQKKKLALLFKFIVWVYFVHHTTFSRSFPEIYSYFQVHI